MTGGKRGGREGKKGSGTTTANLRTKTRDFRGLDSSRILIQRGILMSIGDSPEGLSRQILAGIILAGRLGVVKTTP